LHSDNNRLRIKKNHRPNPMQQQYPQGKQQHQQMQQNFLPQGPTGVVVQPLGTPSPTPPAVMPQPAVVVQRTPVVVAQTTQKTDLEYQFNSFTRDVDRSLGSLFGSTSVPRGPVLKVGACCACRAQMQYTTSGQVVAVACYNCKTVNQFR